MRSGYDEHFWIANACVIIIFLLNVFFLQLLPNERENVQTFLCLAISFPSVPKTQQVLYNLSPVRSGIEPPIIVIFRLREISDNILVEGDASPPASMSSAYTGKLSLEYGLFHISCHSRKQLC